MTDVEGVHLFHKAKHFAQQKHEGQTYQGRSYYDGHILPVIDFLLSTRIDDPRILAIAALHDVVEDCGVEIETIYELFGQRIGDGVDAMSRRKITNPDGTIVKEAEADYLSRVAANPDAVITKMADSAHNLLMSQRPACPPEKQGKAPKYINALSVLVGVRQNLSAPTDHFDDGYY